MKRFVTATMALVVATILSTTAFAQHPRHKTDDHKAQREQKFAAASKRLNLTPDQEQKLKEILIANKAEMKTLKEANKNASKDEKRTAVLTQLKKLDGQVTAVLDAKQLETYQQMKAEKKKELQEKRAKKIKEKEEMEEYEPIL